MARSRRQFREMEVLAVLVMQGAIIPCKRCRHAFTIEDVKNGGVQKEHLHELALGGEDEPHNCAYSHTGCHAIITNGNGATTAGSSSNRRAKANNPGRTEKFKVVKPPLDDHPTAFCSGCETEVDPRQPHRCPAGQQRADERARRLHTIHAPAARCRRCGEDSDLCTCPPQTQRSSFARAR